MPPGMRMRYDAPAPALAECVTAYAVYAHDGSIPAVNWFMPAPPMISVVVDAGPLCVSIRNTRFGPLSRASLYGPTSRAFCAETNGGIMVGVGVSAIGWARLARRMASDLHNRVVPLASVFGAGLSNRLTDGLDALHDDADIKPLLDDLLAPLLARPHPDEPLIRRFSVLMLQDGVVESGDAATRLDIPTHALRRLSQRHFGMTPKLLLRRARFLRSFLALMRTGEPADYSVIDGSYFDVPHFLRDAETFLGTTPRRFLQNANRFLHASIVARAAVLGAATHALHDVASPGRAPTSPAAKRTNSPSSPAPTPAP